MTHPNDGDPRPLLDYLDKEGNVMGLLTLFCLGVLAIVLERLTSAAQGSYLGTIWANGEPYVWTASGLMLAAALLFYKQRSTLMWVHGLITFALAAGPRGGRSLVESIALAHRWQLWMEYQVAWRFLLTGIVAYVLGLMSLHIGLLRFRPSTICISSGLVVLAGFSALCAWWEARRRDAAEAPDDDE